MAAPRRILITGASGFVGSHLLPALRQGFPAARLLTDPFDVTDKAATDAAVRSAAPDACVHLAGIAAIQTARRDPDRAWQVNLHGTLNLAYSVLRHAPECRLLFVSSADVYGRSFQSGKPVDETAVPAPMNAYGATKAAADLALGALAGEGLRVIRLRPFNHTGPGQAADFVVAAFARQVARIAAGLQPPLLHTGALDPWRDFLDVRDVCAAYVACLSRADTLPSGVILNIASGIKRRVGDILAQLLDIARVTARIETDGARLRPSEIPTASGSAAEARNLLGWAPTIPWETTLADVLADWHGRVAADPAA